MKDPKDHKKFELPPLESLLSAKFAPTQYGLVCYEMEVLCLSCRKGEVIVVPDEFLAMVDNEDLAGSAFAEYIAEQKGWLIKSINRISGKPALFMLCHDCVEKLFKTHEK